MKCNLIFKLIFINSKKASKLKSAKENKNIKNNQNLNLQDSEYKIFFKYTIFKKIGLFLIIISKNIFENLIQIEKKDFKELILAKNKTDCKNDEILNTYELKYDIYFENSKEPHLPKIKESNIIKILKFYNVEKLKIKYLGIDKIFEIKFLKKLYIKGISKFNLIINKITDIYELFEANFENFEILYFENNKTKDIIILIFKNFNLFKFLGVSENKISDLNEVSNLGLNEFIKIDENNNKIFYIKVLLVDFLKLKIKNLSNNKISTNKVLQKLKLVKLIAFSNGMSNINIADMYIRQNSFKIIERSCIKITENNKNNNIKVKIEEKNNVNNKEKKYENKELMKNNISRINEQYKNINNERKNAFEYYKFKRTNLIKYLIIFILINHLCYIQTNLRNYKQNKVFIFCLNEITLKVKGIGIKNILSTSYSNTYPNPSKIYLNNILIENLVDFHYINIEEVDSEIKIEWSNTNIYSIKGMFYNCKEILEIDMTKFDTSLVTDMSEMFAFCYSLKSLNVSNLITTQVKEMQNMFSGCSNLTSLNLESFTIPSVTSLYRMFYDCINLQYINIKNFEEKQNINIDEMFYNIAPNAVICLSLCPPPTNFTIISMTTTIVTISWIGREWNNFIISYGLQGLSDPNNGNKITVTNKENYEFTNLNSGTKYDVYIKTDCGNKSSYWLGPLSVSIGSYNIAHTGKNSITTCSKIIYDPGGPNANYDHYANSTLIIYPETSQQFISIKGKVDMENCCDYLSIYNGIGTNGNESVRYNGYKTVPLFISTTGPLTIKFTTDYSVVSTGFELTVGCMHISKTIYDLIKSNNCFKISCNTDWLNIQNFVDLDTGICMNDCFLESNKYQYRGKCYNNCPDNTSNNNYKCYSNSILEKCGEYSLESEYENLCIKCKNNYYPMLSDKTNKNNFINCYKNNSLEKYYLDQNDSYFKSCYKSCRICIQGGTLETHNCLQCDINYEFNLTLGEYYNCYPNCDYYYYFDK